MLKKDHQQILKEYQDKTEKLVQVQKRSITRLLDEVEWWKTQFEESKQAYQEAAEEISQLSLLPRRSIWEEIQAERTRQDEKWGGLANEDNYLLGDLVEQIDIQSSLLIPGCPDPRQILIEMAALAVAAIESIDREIRLREG